MPARPFALLIATALGASIAVGCARNEAQTAASATTAAAHAAHAPHAALGNASRCAEIFRANCAVCHTTTGTAGGIGPSLEHEKQHKNYDQTIAWIEQPDPPMPKLYPSPLSEKDVADVAAYVQSL
jgi:mono/diheme cytochrome c family protein